MTTIVLDDQGARLQVGTLVSTEEGMRGRVTAITDPDGDTDSDGRQVEILPSVSVVGEPDADWQRRLGCHHPPLRWADYPDGAGYYLCDGAQAMVEPPPWGQPAAATAPAGACVWGARWIFPDDMLPDRQGFNGQPGLEQLRHWLNHPTDGITPIEAAMAQARQFGYAMGLHPMSRAIETLFTDSHGLIRGTPNGSGGYMYVAAYLHPTNQGGIR